MARNLELKVRCDESSLLHVRASAEAIGVPDFSELTQTDTYFAVASGRLKLREIESANGGRCVELIAYRRADDAGSRWSDFHRVSLDNETETAVKAVLSLVPGVSVVIRKRRLAGIWRNTRIHLDTVENHGCFVELETVLKPGDAEADVHKEHATAIERLGLARMPVVSGSYRDLAGAVTLSASADHPGKGAAR